MEIASYQQEPPQPGQGIVLHDTYRLQRQIGFGGMGVVYEAIHNRLPGRFAVKALLRSLMSNVEAFTRFCREAEIMSGLRHPNIVQIIDFNLTPDQQPYFVMEYMNGRNLRDALADGGPMDLSKVVNVTQSVASALAEAHRNGVIHRDLKPSNIFLCAVEGWADPFVKVFDFGVSKVRSANRISWGGDPIGTPRYMAPEQATGRIDEIDGHTDQFALAAIVYEMLTGRDAFVGADAQAVLAQVVHQDPQPLTRYFGWDCDGVQAVLSRALAKDPARRYPTVTAFALALTEAAGAASVSELARPANLAISWVPATTAEDLTAEALAPAADDRDTGPWSDGEITETIDRVPRGPHRAIFLALVALVLCGGLLASGHARTIREDAAITFRSLVARVTSQPPLDQPDMSSGPREAAPPAVRPLPPEPALADPDPAVSPPPPPAPAIAPRP